MSRYIPLRHLLNRLINLRTNRRRALTWWLVGTWLQTLKISLVFLTTFLTGIPRMNSEVGQIVAIFWTA
jgi:hypothetical protein